ncbi:MAG: cation diffusion facilitator family transporter [Syntrophales bacterium]|nr:cation diffusion facilitator family transporter [Syntrophales bacterium]MDX9922130.1 cation diffusion facilitator family transporter [Syntrophales bacterium]
MVYTQQDKASAARLSVASNTGLVALKLTVGVFTGSMAVISEAIHSGIDLLASFIALISVKASAVPPDRSHPFGHEKIENISGSIEALLILLAAAWIVYESIHRLINPEPVSLIGLGAAVMAVSAAVNLLVSRRLFAIGYAAESVALQGNAWHLRTDVYTSLGVLAGLLLIMVARWAFPGLDVYWLDPLAALCVAVLIGVTGWRVLVKAFRDLVDARLPDDEEALIRSIIASGQPKVLGYNHLRTRRAGRVRFVEFRMKVDSGMTVDQSHSLAEEVTSAIRNEFPGTNVSIHVEPCAENCRGGACPEGCFVGVSPGETRRS